MKTIVIWHNWEDGVDFFVLDGDYRHLDRVYVGSGTNIARENVLGDILCDKDGNWKVSLLHNFPIEALHTETSTAVIVCGFIP